MASSILQNDLSTCSICFEKFRTPRSLPCSHLFCHGCLSSYIVTSCESKEAPVGFSCPLCREFIPSPVPINKPENWAEKFPVCKILEKINQLKESRLCSACQRENEEEEAEDICLTCQEPLCRSCTKYHRRNLASQTHKTISLNMIDKPKMVMELTTSLLSNENCQEHPDRKSELYCNDHSKAYCTLCVSTEHRKCDSIEDIQRAVERIKNGNYLQSLQEELTKYEVELQKAKKNHEDNISEIDNTSDLFTEETKELKKEIIDQLDKFEVEHQDKLSKVTKESREMLNKNVDSLSDRIQFASHCLKSVKEVKEKTGASFMKEYQKIKDNFELVKKHNWTKKELPKIKIESSAARDLEQVKSAVFNLNPQVKNSASHTVTDLSKAQFSLLYDFGETNLYVFSGIFLPDETFIIANFQSNKIGLIRYSVNYDASTSLQTFRSLTNSHLFDIRCVGDELYVTDNTHQRVKVISNDNFTTLREFSVPQTLSPFGLAVWRNFLFIACETAIVKYDMQGNLIHSYPVENRVLYVLVMESGHIVYSNTNNHSVSAMGDQGTSLWTYNSPKLRKPYSVDKDEMDHIYVAGADSDSIHILSSSGSLIRIVDDIPRPAFMKVKEKSNICCVCSHWKKLSIYEIK